MQIDVFSVILHSQEVKLYHFDCFASSCFVGISDFAALSNVRRNAFGNGKDVK